MLLDQEIIIISWHILYHYSVLIWHFHAAFTYWDITSHPPSDMLVLDRMWYHMKASPWVIWIFSNTCFHLLWVSLLLLSQMYQMMYLGVTTNERINAFRYDHFKTTKHGTISSKSPFDRGIINNTADLFRCSCFGMARPLVIDWRTKLEFPPEFTSPNTSRCSAHETV